MRISDWSSDVCSADLDLSVLNDQFDDFGRGTHLHAPFLGRQDLGSGESSACAPLSGFQMALEAGADMLSAGLHLDPFVRRGKTVAIAIGGEIGRASCRERVCPYV